MDPQDPNNKNKLPEDPRDYFTEQEIKEMKWNMRYHLHGDVLFITFGVEEGLLLPCNPFIQLIFLCCLARAIELHPVKLCHFLLEGTHAHLLLVVDNPEDVAGFMCRLKTETAHRINRALDRPKRTVWEDGYDDPTVLSQACAILAAGYLYGNPAKDNLESIIESYPGTSSWELFAKGETEMQCVWVSRNDIRPIPLEKQTSEGFQEEAAYLTARAERFITLKLHPDALPESFGVTAQAQKDAFKQRIEARVRRVEARAERVRKTENKTVIGREVLLNQPFDLTYQPQRRGQKSWCFTHSHSERKRFIAEKKNAILGARVAYSEWKKGNTSLRYPDGMYAPCMPRMSNINVAERKKKFNIKV